MNQNPSLPDFGTGGGEDFANFEDSQEVAASDDGAARRRAESKEPATSADGMCGAIGAEAFFVAQAVTAIPSSIHSMSETSPDSAAEWISRSLRTSESEMADGF